MSKKHCAHRPTSLRPSRASAPPAVRARVAARPSTPPAGPRLDDAAATRRALVADVCALGADPPRASAAVDAAWRAWEAVPEVARRGEILAALVRGGWFARVAHACAEGRDPDGAVALALADRANAGVAGLRAVVMRWVVPLREAPRAACPLPCDGGPLEDDAPLSRSAPPLARHLRRERAAILRRLAEGDESAAWRGVERLVAAQLRAPGAGDAALSLCDLATRADAQGLHALQLRLTERAVAVRPDDDWAWQQHSVALRRVGRLDEAAEAARRAAERREHPVHHASLAVVLRDAGRFDEALAASEGAARRRPDDVRAWLGLAGSLRASGRFDESLDAYERAVRAAPTHGPALGGRAEALKAMGRLREALAAYDEALRVLPHDGHLHTGRASVLRRLGRLPEALAAYDEAARLRPGESGLRVGRAHVLKAMGRLTDALAGYDEALAAGNDSDSARCERADALLRLGRPFESLAGYEDVLRRHPSHAAARAGHAAAVAAVMRRPEIARALAPRPTAAQPRRARSRR